uniref:Small integral membrane protein 26 n=1 Tax=Hippocampus comes TaxID=109280 RepID=A0A3Q2YJZ7_HIPCM
MTLKDARKWNRSVSTVYVLGVWTMIGSVAYLYYTGRFKNSTEATTGVPKNPNEFIYQTPHNKTIVVYKKDFVPYTTRIYNFVQSFTGGPGTADK